MQNEIQLAVDQGTISPQAAQILNQLPPGSFAIHKSWGCGRVEGHDFALRKIRLAFAGGQTRELDLAFAATTLTPIPEDHVEAARLTDPAPLRAAALAAPCDFIHRVIRDFEGRLTLEGLTEYLRELLPDSAFPSEAKEPFKRWWTSARNQLKSDTRFLLPARKTLPIELREGGGQPHLDLVTAFEKARLPKEKIAVAEEALRSLEAFQKEPAELDRLVSLLDRAAQELQRQRNHVTTAIHLLCVRDALSTRCGREPAAGGTDLASLLQGSPSRLAEILAPLPPARLRDAVRAAMAASGEAATTQLLALLQEGDSKVVNEAARNLLDRDAPAFAAALQKSIAERTANPEALAWLLARRPEALAALLNPETLLAAITIVEREMLKENRRAQKLQKVISDDKKLMPVVLESASPGEGRDLMRKLMRTPIFEDTDKRALLARAIRVRPELQELLETGEDKAPDSSASQGVIVSWPSLERRKADYDELVNVRIPANSRDIQVAREQGDLRENAGFKFAKEQQAVLLRQKAELEQALATCRGTDFAGAETSRAGIGTVVRLRDAATGVEEELAILGAWDGDSAKGIISYLAAAAQALMGRGPGDKVTLPSDSGGREVEILGISAFKNLDIL